MKTTLLAICGLTPKIITETLYALHQDGRTVDEIRVLTTSEGKAACIARLFGANDGYYFKYMEDYGFDLELIDFSPEKVLAVKDEHGDEIFDIDTERENELFLKECMKHTFALTSDSDRAVYFLISGGTKTMSACLSLAAQCYGRPIDRIYHVLATPEFDQSFEFYYPPKKPQKIEIKRRDGKFSVMDTADAEITLVPMPFFSLRSELSEEMLHDPESPATLMMSVVKDYEDHLVINLPNRKVSWMGKEIDMPPRLIALYAFFAKFKLDNGCNDEYCRCSKCFLSYHSIREQQILLTEIYKYTNSLIDSERLTNSGITELTIENFISYKSRINDCLIKNFGLKFAHHISIQENSKKEHYKLFGIKKSAKNISVIIK